MFLALRELNASFWVDIREAAEPPALPPFKSLADLKDQEVLVCGIFEGAGQAKIQRHVELHGGTVPVSNPSPALRSQFRKAVQSDSS